MNQDFVAIYDLYRDSIFRYCLGKCRDPETSEDLTQETFVRFWLFLQSGKKILHARGFLYRIAHNLFVDHVRRRKEVSLDQLVEVGFEPAVDPWHKTYSRMDSEIEMKKLNKSRSPYRKVLHCRFMLGLAPAQIAKLTGETAGTISVRIYRGLQFLRTTAQPAA